MKIEIEIKDDKMFFNYRVGTSSHNSTSNLTPEYLVAFTDILKIASDASRRVLQDKFEQMKADARNEIKKD